MSEDAQPPEPPAPPPVRLENDEHNAIIEHINRMAVAPDDACSVCGSPANFVAGEVYRINTLTDPIVAGGVHQPLLSTVCRNCGYVRFFNRLVVDRLIADHNEAAKDDDGQAR